MFVWLANRDFSKFDKDCETLLDHVEYPKDLRSKIEAGFRGIGGTDENIRLLENQSNRELGDLFGDLRKKIEERWRKNKARTFIYFHYCGEAILSNDNVVALCNTANKKEMTFQIESAIKALAKLRGAYIFAILDCSRKKVDTNMLRFVRQSFMNQDSLIMTGELLKKRTSIIEFNLMMLFACDSGEIVEQ